MIRVIIPEININDVSSLIQHHDCLFSLEKRVVLNGNGQFAQKVTFEPLMDFKQHHYGSWKYYKSCYF